MGESGVGKSAVTQEICKRYGLLELQSYTTRKQRFPNETGHIFLSGLTVDEIKRQFPERVAETLFDNEFYFATRQQVDKCDIYVVDPQGIEYLKTKYKGKKKIKVIYLRCIKFTRIARMQKRGDSPEQISDRITNDSLMFKDASSIADVIIYNDSFERTVADVWEYITKAEGKK